jgi:hypothetical protein
VCFPSHPKGICSGLDHQRPLLFFTQQNTLHTVKTLRRLATVEEPLRIDEGESAPAEPIALPKMTEGMEIDDVEEQEREHRRVGTVRARLTSKKGKKKMKKKENKASECETKLQMSATESKT